MSEKTYSKKIISEVEHFLTHVPISKRILRATKEIVISEQELRKLPNELKQKLDVKLLNVKEFANSLFIKFDKIYDLPFGEYHEVVNVTLTFKRIGNSIKLLKLVLEE